MFPHLLFVLLKPITPLDGLYNPASSYTYHPQRYLTEAIPSHIDASPQGIELTCKDIYYILVEKGGIPNPMNTIKQQDVIIQEQSSYMDIFQKRPTRYRMYETVAYMVVMVILASYMPTDSGFYKVLAVLSAIVIIGGAPIVYGKWLSPEYILTKNELIIRMSKEERTFSLLEVERASDWKALFRLNGKKEPLMVSRTFLGKLDDQIAKIRRAKKR